MPKVKTRIMNNSWLRQREIGQRFPLGYADRFSKELYSSLVPCTSWEYGENIRSAMHGGVFNLEFSPDGSLLVAACEKKSILMFDPLCRRLIHAVDNAHRDCVNCVRFLDSRVFATCSDDSTVALWDARNLKTQIRTLHGHSNWVKNIEFSPRDGLLVTSGFDGSIYTWDINSYTENGFVYNRVFHTNGLMRTRLNPDASKMIICTTGGYLMVIHNLDLTSLGQDLAGFKPNMYRLMQLSQTTIPLAADFTHLFSRHRTVNRVEFVADFPKGDDAEVVSSLQVHPQGWCALSRNISNDENSEWTCVHDIQDPEYSDTDVDSCGDDDEDDDGSTHRKREFCAQDSDSDGEPTSNRRPRVMRSNLVLARPMVELRSDSRPLRTTRVNLVLSEDEPSPTPTSSAARALGLGRNDDGIPIQHHRRIVGDVGRLPLSPANVELHVSSADVWEALVAIREARIRRERERERAEREERERLWQIERRMNVRVRLCTNGPSNNAEGERRNVEDGASSSGNIEDWGQGRFRILFRRNPEGQYTIVDDPPGSTATGAGEAGQSSGGSAVNGDERTISVEANSNSLPMFRENAEAYHRQSGERRPVPPPQSAAGSSSTSTGNRGTNTSDREVDQILDENTGMFTPRSSSTNTILIVDNRMPRTASAAVISAPLGGGSEPTSTIYRVNTGSRSDYGPKRNRRIHQNISRLTHYIEEPNVGKGFIKELCFSADGRLICSPFGCGVRLLAFSPECAELSSCVPPKPPVKLYELATNVCHSDIVVSTKFSPRHCLLVSGCLRGKIVWHQPVV